MGSFRTLFVDRPESAIVVARLDRPERLNAITFEMVDEFVRLQREVESDAAAGAGMALALAADIWFAATTARCNAAFVRIGLSGGDVGTSWALPRLVGPGRAYEILLTGRFVEADEALHIGLVTDVVPPDQLLDRTLETARMIVGSSPVGTALTKQVVQTNVDAPSREAASALENRKPGPHHAHRRHGGGAHRVPREAGPHLPRPRGHRTRRSVRGHHEAPHLADTLPPDPTAVARERLG